MVKKLFVTLTVIIIVALVAKSPMAENWISQPKASFERVSHHVEAWLVNNEITHSSPLLEKMKHFFESGEISMIEIENKKAPDEHQSATSDGIEGPTDQPKTVKEVSLSEFELEVVELVNEERAQQGLNPLEPHQRLSGLARVKSKDMADYNYFSHTSPNYGSPFDMMNQFNFEYRAAGENIAAGQRSPEQVVEGWMNSEGHRKNILNKTFTHIGVGYTEGSGSYGTYWTQLFMTPR